MGRAEQDLLRYMKQKTLNEEIGDIKVHHKTQLLSS